MPSVRPRFARHVGVDYSGAGTAEERLPGLAVCVGEGGEEPTVVRPAGGRRWSRRDLAGWLEALLAEPVPTLVGVDHAFSFPLAYFQHHRLERDWDVFLDDFHRHWPTDEMRTYVDFVREGVCGNGAARMGDSRWRRVCDLRARAKSPFHFDAPGTVAKSTHAGLPWLLRLRRALGGHVHWWPFDGWDPPAGRSMVAEVYPALWNRAFPRRDRDAHQHDAYCVAAWLQRADRSGDLEAILEPTLGTEERAAAVVEGWILGLP